MLDILKTLNNDPNRILTKEELEYLKYLIKLDIPIDNEIRNYLANIGTLMKSDNS